MGRLKENGAIVMFFLRHIRRCWHYGNPYSEKMAFGTGIALDIYIIDNEQDIFVLSGPSGHGRVRECCVTEFCTGPNLAEVRARAGLTEAVRQ